MEKFAEAAFNLIILAHQMRDDTSDFGKLCVSELNSIAEKLLEGTGDGSVEWFKKAKTWLQLLTPLLEALKSSSKKDLADKLNIAFSAYRENGISLTVLSNAAKTMGVGEALSKYSYEISQMAKQNPNMQTFLRYLTNKT